MEKFLKKYDSLVSWIADDIVRKLSLLGLAVILTVVTDIYLWDNYHDIGVFVFGVISTSIGLALLKFARGQRFRLIRIASAASILVVIGRGINTYKDIQFLSLADALFKGLIIWILCLFTFKVILSLNGDK